MHICVCICTYRRTELLRRLLEAVQRQSTDGLFTVSVVVADNDRAQSALATVQPFAPSLKVIYCVQPQKNVAMVRNSVLQHAKGDFFAFIDDDELPPEDWLLRLLSCCQRSGADGVLGPVLPSFEQPPPKWILQGRFFDRPRHPTGFEMPWGKCRTGNVLLRASILEKETQPFNPVFASFGEDVDFFRRMMQKGHRFVWCDEASVSESVPPERATRQYLLSRALLRGRASFNHPVGRGKRIAESIVAVPVYLLALAPLALLGYHFFVKYLIKLCDHTGRLMAFAGVSLPAKGLKRGNVEHQL